MVSRLLAAGAAFCLGWVVYMIGMILTTYDGLLSLVFQPFMAAFVSGLFVGIALVAGLVLRIKSFGWWRKSPMAATMLAGGGLFILGFGYFLGITYVGVHPETGAEVVILHPGAAVAAYFGLIFAIANWPVRSQRISEGTV